MSEARNQRFEIDIDEIERQLRRSVEQPAEARPDPLAELARIVGQNDPFQGILAGGQPARPAAPAAPANANQPSYPEAQDASYPAALQAHPADHAYDPHRPRHDDFGPSADAQHPYDPVSAAYGSQQDALAEEEFQPLRRRPSRGKLIAVMAALLVTVSAVAAGMMMRKPGGFLAPSGPPVIVADKSPLKVAPENPGGVEVPNQDRQIYARGPQDGQSRVVDGREQPVDVRAATPPVSARAPVSAERNPVSDALGEPKRVRTVAVNPDGTSYGPTATGSTPATKSQNVIPSGDLPPPVPVQTIAVPARSGAQPPAAAAQQAPQAQPAPPVAQPAAEPPPTHQAVSVLPPARPNIEAPTRTASIPPAAAQAPKPAAPAAKPKPAAEAAKPVVAARTEAPAAEKPAASRTYSVQIAVRPSEQEARTAWDQAQEKFGASLENKPARLTSAKVGGKTVHRVRLGPMTKPEADAMCGRLKAKGGACFVAQN
jgi:hypothetical protein